MYAVRLGNWSEAYRVHLSSPRYLNTADHVASNGPSVVGAGTASRIACPITRLNLPQSAGAPFRPRNSIPSCSLGTIGWRDVSGEASWRILSGLAFSAYGNPDGFLSGSHAHGFT